MKNKLSEIEQELISNLGVIGKYTIRITRADGTVEDHTRCNQVTANGLNILASRGISDTNSPFAWLAIGTVTNAASLGSTEFGEVSRKAPATLASSKEVFMMVMTWAGNADSLTSVDIQSAAMVNHVNSGQGTVFNIVNNVNATLGDSDFLLLQAEVQVGSHNL
jgi:hypothetical protein